MPLACRPGGQNGHVAAVEMLLVAQADVNVRRWLRRSLRMPGAEVAQRQRGVGRKAEARATLRSVGELPAGGSTRQGLTALHR